MSEKNPGDLPAQMAAIRFLIESLPGAVVVLWAPPVAGFEIEYSEGIGAFGAVGLMEVAKAHILKELL